MNELQRLRLNANLTVEDLARETGVPITTIYNLESGRVTNPRQATISPLAARLGVPAGDLLAALRSAQAAA